MLVQNIAELAGQLAKTDIAVLELTGPDGRLCLRNTPSGVAEASEPMAVALPGPESIVLTASSPGTFLRNHPLRASLIVQAGDKIEAGQIVGLLQIGLLLRPVISPQAGVLAGALAEHGALVGYGTELMELQVETAGESSGN